jgi:hypothetical protein
MQYDTEILGFSQEKKSDPPPPPPSKDKTEKKGI